MNIKISNSDYVKITNFEKVLNEVDLIYNFFISKFDKDFTYYQIIFNGAPDIFLKTMNESNFNFDIQNKFWVLK